MKNTIRTLLIITSTLIIVAAVITSCISLNQNARYVFTKKRSTAPVDAFVLIEVNQKMTPVSCQTTDKNIDCKKLLSSLPPVESGWSGSGLLVESSAGPGILTAAHVCRQDTPVFIEHKGVRIVISKSTVIKAHSPIKGTYTTKILRLDLGNDLCLLKPNKVFTYPIAIAKEIPKMGNKVYAIAAPYGISGQNMALVFSGFYSGNKDGRAFYTIPTRPGSSGAAVLNEKWEVIGMIHTAFRYFESVGIGTDLMDVRTFLFSSSSEFEI